MHASEMAKVLTDRPIPGLEEWIRTHLFQLFKKSSIPLVKVSVEYIKNTFPASTNTNHFISEMKKLGYDVTFSFGSKPGDGEAYTISIPGLTEYP